MSWIQYALLSGFLLGVRTITSRLSFKLGLGSEDGIAYQALGLSITSFILYLGYWWLGYGRVDRISDPGASSALFTGVLTTILVGILFIAVKDGYVSLVLAVRNTVALIVAVVCASALGDELNIKQYVAVALAIIASILAV